MRTHTKDTQESLTPEHALEILKEGNERFVNNIKAHRNLLEQVNTTSSGQFPFAAVLSCIDSRTSAELIFDQGLGDILSIRIAGNILNDDILGSMEFSCHLAGSKLIVVLGHTKCGAIEGACNNIEIGHITTLLEKIRPAVEMEKTTKENRTASNRAFVDNVTNLNILHSVRQIRARSPLLDEMAKAGKIMIIGGLYDLETGKVSFFDAA